MQASFGDSRQSFSAAEGPPPLRIDAGDAQTGSAPRFADAFGRGVILRGFNLGGDCKLPYPDGGTHNPDDFARHRDVSFIGRPFPLEDAEEHFGRLRAWGCNCLRLLTTWEAVEHAGPGLYDEAYLDYYAELCRLAGRFGMYVFVDFHQDVFSRMTGGDGAPGWVLEKVGMDIDAISASDSAIVMQHAYDFSDPRPRQEDNYPTMVWSQNYHYPANRILWTLFFAGREFAAGFSIDGENVQDYLQGHFLGAVRAAAERVAEFPHVIGFDSLNEPHRGMIGKHFVERELRNRPGELVHAGPALAPLDCLLVARGESVTAPVLDISLWRGGIKPVGKKTFNPEGRQLWSPDGPCAQADPFEQSGAWAWRGGDPEVLRPDHLRTKRNGEAADFERDFLFPFVGRVAETIRSVRRDWMIFAEKPPFETFQRPDFPENRAENMVNASHWYDGLTLLLKRFLYPVALDALRTVPVFGRKGIENMYANQLRRLREASDRGGMPALVGEFGIPFDMQGARAYARYAAGHRGPRVWKTQSLALELMYNAMDRLLLNCTLWNYTASNRNDPRIGDGWNQEDLSVFSRDQQDTPEEIHSGGRALEGFVRPVVRAVQGRLIAMQYVRGRSGSERSFVFSYDADPQIEAPTVVYVPGLFFGTNLIVQAEGARIETRRDAGRGMFFLVHLYATRSGRIDVRIVPGPHGP